MRERNRILYVCSLCDDRGDHESCGRFDPAELRVLPDGRWACDGCYDDAPVEDLGIKMDVKPSFNSLPPAPKYAPTPNP